MNLKLKFMIVAVMLAIGNFLYVIVSGNNAYAEAIDHSLFQATAGLAYWLAIR